jgi:BirA family transcriptional regulator, biotin operon repressor / biotin---[acetyl-CoA-carboxylase] ligase
MPDAYLDAAAIRAATFIRHVEVHDTLGSTNDRAAELARDAGIELPALVVARHQTAGRGRGNNKWHATEGSLTFSVLLEPGSLGISTANWPQLSLATAVAICDALSSQLNPQSEISNPKSPRLAIKWPNDILLDGAKLCGILIESPGGAAPSRNRLVIGIGINVNNSWQNSDPAQEFCPTSCCDATGHVHNMQTVLIDVLNAFEQRLSQHAANNVHLSQGWQNLSWLNGKEIDVHLNDEPVLTGICSGIDCDGGLLIKTADGNKKIYSGSVSLSS